MRRARAFARSLDDYRVVVEIDPDHSWEEADGGPMPATRERYDAIGHFQVDGRDVPYEEYLRYYGDPDRHVALQMRLQVRCTCCGEWKDDPADDTSLCGIDFMDDSDEIARVSLPEDAIPAAELIAVDDYLAEITREFLIAAGAWKYAPLPAQRALLATKVQNARNFPPKMRAANARALRRFDRRHPEVAAACAG